MEVFDKAAALLEDVKSAEITNAERLEQFRIKLFLPAPSLLKKKESIITG